jgi:hypothetical protein
MKEQRKQRNKLVNNDKVDENDEVLRREEDK